MDKEDAECVCVCVCVCVRTQAQWNITQPGERRNPATVTWMDLHSIMLSEIKSDKDKYCMISFICGI